MKPPLQSCFLILLQAVLPVGSAAGRSGVQHQGRFSSRSLVPWGQIRASQLSAEASHPLFFYWMQDRPGFRLRESVIQSVFCSLCVRGCTRASY